jgi:photosystem II stability/assembly factor-like uncharacterized protein
MRNVFFLLSFLLLSTPVLASWTRPGGLYGADVRAMVIHPSHPDRIYIGTSHGEVYVSEDGAKSWRNPHGSLPFPGFVVKNLEFDMHGRLWMSGWGVWGGGIVAVSEDAGRNWVRRDQGLDGVAFRAMALGKNDPDLVVVGGLHGVWRSRDAGKSWARISDRENVDSLAIDPRSDDTIYVGTYRQAWRTDDGGKSWKHIAEGMVLDTDVFSINIDPNNPDDVWLGTCGWVYHSPNRGDNWTRYRDGFDNRRIHVTARDVINPSCIYAGSVAGLYRTLDRGAKWERITDDRLVINQIGIHPERPNRIILGTEGDGIYVSWDRGKTFHRHSQGLHNLRISSIVTDPANRDTAYAVKMFAGQSSGIYRTRDRGRNWEKMNRTDLPEILTLVVQGEATPRFVAGTERGFYFSEDGAEWTRAEPATVPLRVEKVLRYNSERLFAATADGVFTSRDSGRSWYRLGQPSSRVLDIAVGMHSGNPALFALTDSSLVRFSQNGWTEIVGAPRGLRLLLLGRDDTLRLVVSGRRTARAGVIDHANRWKDLDINIPANSVIHAVDGQGKLIFFTSGDERHLLMAESGKKFTGTGLALDASEVTWVAADRLDPERLYVGTTGSGLFIFDAGKKDSAGQPVLAGGGSAEGSDSRK